MSMTASAQAAIDLKDAQDAYKKAYDYRLSLNGKQWIEEVRIKYVGRTAGPRNHMAQRATLTSKRSRTPTTTWR